MNSRKLIDTLQAVGKPTETWTSPDGSSAIVLPYGGRVIGLFAPGDEENFFWTHRALESVDSARDFYAGDQWHNSGGDRTWLAPEIDFFFPNFPSLDSYFQQRELDPGNYIVSQDADTLTWKNEAKLSLSRTGQRVECEITKSLSPALNPLRYEQADWTDVRFAGYTLSASLQIVGSEQPPHAGLWHLTQLPHGGEMMVPTYFRSEPKTYMGSIGADDLIVDEHMVRYKMRAGGEHKIGIRAAAITGRVGYIYSSQDHTSLVVRNFFVDPSAEYVDTPWTETDNFGFAVQACSIKSELLHLGQFSELEYHVPAIGAKVGRTLSQDHSQLWAFRGPASKIQFIARQLLSAGIK